MRDNFINFIKMVFKIRTKLLYYLMIYNKVGKCHIYKEKNLPIHSDLNLWKPHQKQKQINQQLVVKVTSRGEEKLSYLSNSIKKVL